MNRTMPEKRFYSIKQSTRDTVDVYLWTETDRLFVVRGVQPTENLEDDIRLRFYDWCESGEEIFYDSTGKA